MSKRLFALFGPLLGLLGCTTQETITPPTPDAGVDAAIDAPATCATACADNERCVDGACTPVDILSLSLVENIQLQGGSVVSTDNSAYACGSLAMAAWTPALPPPLAVEGACKVWSYDPASIPAGPAKQPTAPGGVTITTPTGMFPLPTMGTDCATATPKLALFTTDGVTAFDGDGTGHFPAFHLEIATPTALQLAAPPLVRGQPLALAWQAATSEGIAIDVYTIPKKGSTTTPPWIRCEVPDTGSYAIPASLTALLDAESTFANVFGWRAAHLTQEPEASPTIVTAYVSRRDQLLLDYTP